jgi:hypothetical protein
MSEVPRSEAIDVVAFLVHQHRNIDALFVRTLDSSGEQRVDNFFELRKLLAIHETLEELVVHRRARREIADGETIANDCLAEEEEVRRALSALESLDVESASFVANLARLHEVAKAHARHEELQEFALLDSAPDGAQEQLLNRVARFVDSLPVIAKHTRGLG